MEQIPWNEEYTNKSSPFREFPVISGGVCNQFQSNEIKMFPIEFN